MGTEQNNAKVPDTKKAKFVDNRKVGVFFIVVAVIVIGVSLIVRIIDSKMSAEYKQVDGVVSSIETKRTYYARKYRYKTTVSVKYSPEGTSLTYFASYSGFTSYFTKEGDVFTVCYKESSPLTSYVAEKDWLTGGYVHAGSGYNVPLIIGAIILLIGVVFFDDGVKTAKSGIDPAKQSEVNPKTGRTFDPEFHEAARIPNKTEDKAPAVSKKKIKLGDTVKVTVDRPLGSYHPEHKDMYYPVNCGYIEGVIAEDGEEQDAYILGVDDPVKEFTGEVIGIVHRDDDVETKLVVAPQNSCFTSEQIMSRINFTEKYYSSHLVMKLKDINIDPEDLIALGFKIREGHCCYFLSMDETPSRDTLLKLFDLLTAEQTLMFWNFYRRTNKSDPGEYISAYIENGKALMDRANHGWSSGYLSVRIDDLIELIQRNWDKDCDMKKNFVNAIEISKTFYPDEMRRRMENPTETFVPDYSQTAW